MTLEKREGWASALPDAFAFVLWLVIAWFARWTATDLVWTLWLSSFVIGYALILWTVFRPTQQLASGIWRARPRADLDGTAGDTSPLAEESVIGIGALFVLGYYTVVFGFVNYFASQMLDMYFPLDGNQFRIWPSFMSFYAEIAHRYWYFLPSAFLAARGAFLRNPLPELTDPRTFERRAMAEFTPPSGLKTVFKSKTMWIGAGALTPGSPPSGDDRMVRMMERMAQELPVGSKAVKKIDSVDASSANRGFTLNELNTPTTGLREAFRGVYRMHVLMIVFMIAGMAHLANFPLYVVVYTCFFFPWRLVSRDASPAARSSG